jgi:hypothetical protein
MLLACYKDTAANPLVANAGVIHKHGRRKPLSRAFFVGDKNGS